MKQHQASYTTLSIILLMVCLVAVNVIGYFLSARIDITTDQLYTVSDGSKKIIEQLEDPLTLKFYFNKSSEEVPPQIKVYAQRVVELLEEYERLSDGLLRLEIYDPKPDTEDEEWAQKYGIQPVPLPSGTALSFGMLATSLDREEVIPFFDPRREDFLEYDISQLILKVMKENKPKIGIISSFSMNGQPAMPGGRPGEPWAILDEFEKTFSVEILESTVDQIPPDVNMLLVIHPKSPSEGMQYALDQFVLRGGRLIVILDPSSREDLANAPPAQMGQMYQPTSDLPRLLKHWGVDYKPSIIVGDFNFPTQVRAGPSGVVSYPIWMSLNHKALDPNHPITSELESMLLPEPGHFARSEGGAYEFTSLIETSLDSGEIDGFMARMGSPINVLKNLKKDRKKRVLAALVRGAFTTAFPNGKPNMADTENESEQSSATDILHLTEAVETNTILLVADSDFITDPFSVKKLNFLGQRIIQPSNDNLNFLLNAVEYLSGNDALMSIRSRGRFSRPFTRVEELQKAAHLRYQSEEKQLQEKLSEVQDRLSQLVARKSGQRILLSSDQQREIQNFREEERKTRKRLREVRKVLRQDIENLGNTLLAINLLTIPFLIGIIGVFVYLRRTRKS